MALYWVGAVAVGAHNLPARIVANIFIWGILVYGGFFLVAYKDWTIGLELSVLAAGKLSYLPEMWVWLMIFFSNWRVPIPHQGHRLPVDLRLRHHGCPLLGFSSSCIRQHPILRWRSCQ